MESKEHVMYELKGRSATYFLACRGPWRVFRKTIGLMGSDFLALWHRSKSRALYWTDSGLSSSAVGLSKRRGGR